MAHSGDTNEFVLSTIKALLDDAEPVALAKALKVSRTALHNIKTGKTKSPSLRLCAAIAAHFGYTLSIRKTGEE